MLGWVNSLSTIGKGFRVAQWAKNQPVMQEMLVQSLGQEDSLKEGMATHSSILAWRIQQRSLASFSPWGHRVGSNWSDWAHNKQDTHNQKWKTDMLTKEHDVIYTKNLNLYMNFKKSTKENILSEASQESNALSGLWWKLGIYQMKDGGELQVKELACMKKGKQETICNWQEAVNSLLLLEHRWKGRAADVDTEVGRGRCVGSYCCAKVLGLYPLVMQTSWKVLSIEGTWSDFPLRGMTLSVWEASRPIYLHGALKYHWACNEIKKITFTRTSICGWK